MDDSHMMTNLRGHAKEQARRAYLPRSSRLWRFFFPLSFFCCFLSFRTLELDQLRSTTKQFMGALYVTVRLPQCCKCLGPTGSCCIILKMKGQSMQRRSLPQCCKCLGHCLPLN